MASAAKAEACQCHEPVFDQGNLSLVKLYAKVQELWLQTTDLHMGSCFVTAGFTMKADLQRHF